MALLAMEQYGCALASLNARFTLAESQTEIAHSLAERRVPVWLPSRMVLAAREIPWAWDVTSDSLAAWLAGELPANRLVLVKHGAARMDAEELAARGIVDPAFPRFLARSRVTVTVLGAADHTRLAARELA
jgi:5-(aminomethyl)-3-furanmethanol phosphate kinase